MTKFSYVWIVARLNDLIVDLEYCKKGRVRYMKEHIDKDIEKTRNAIEELEKLYKSSLNEVIKE